MYACMHVAHICIVWRWRSSGAQSVSLSLSPTPNSNLLDFWCGDLICCIQHVHTHTLLLLQHVYTSVSIIGYPSFFTMSPHAWDMHSMLSVHVAACSWHCILGDEHVLSTCVVSQHDYDVILRIFFSLCLSIILFWCDGVSTKTKLPPLIFATCIPENLALTVSRFCTLKDSFKLAMRERERVSETGLKLEWE